MTNSLHDLVVLSDSVSLYLGDCREIIPTLGKVDAVVTDPPYGTGKLCTNGGSYKVKPERETYEWDVWDASWIDATGTCPKAVFTPPGRLVEMLNRGGRLLAAVSKQGVCVKNVSPRYGLQPVILLGKAPVNYAPDWMEFVNDGQRKMHPSQKPDNIMSWLVQMCADEGATVLDPYMGSGTTGIACIRTGRKFIGIENDARYFEVARARLENELRQGLLPLKHNARPDAGREKGSPS